MNMIDSVDPHLSDDMLNEWLDAALEAPARAAMQAHLATCSACSARLEALRAVFSGLAALSPTPLARDLRSGVMAAVRAQNHRAALRPVADPRRPTFQLVFAVQLLSAVALFAFAWPFLSGLAQPAPLVTAGDISSFVVRLAAGWPDFGSLWAAIQLWLATATSQPALPLSTVLQPIVAALVLVAAGVFWPVGNVLLLRASSAPTSRRNS